ncbi:MAG: C40 family peptidase [Dysgonomonas sp.]|nr:C40 family peptidase [Dysgonomonas sp.]
MKYLLYSVLFILFLVSCGTSETTTSTLYDPIQVAQLSQKLGIQLKNTDKEDDKNIPLYAESSLWLKTPYRTGGVTRKGVDCSGFVNQIYKKVYKIKLPRSTSEMSSMKMTQISKQNLQTGDLVFFATSKKQINHVGIYFKDGYFVHASTSKGVIVSHLNENYYKQTWRKGGRVK